ncbi:hypothetical protein EOA38_36240, partial [Mesorhizobium sp. M1E.F.Ca.ET.041.01.1.1]
MWEKVSPKATDEGCSRERRRLTPLEHPSSVSALRADPPSPTRVFGPGTSRTGVRGHREQFCMLSGEGIEVDGFYFLMSEPGVEDAVGGGGAESDGLS